MGLEAVPRLVMGEHTFHLTWAVEGEISLTPGALSFAVDVSIQHGFTLQQETGERQRRGCEKWLRRPTAVHMNSSES